MNPINTLPYSLLKTSFNIILPTELMLTVSIFVYTVPEVHGRLNPDHFFSFRFKFPHTVNSDFYVCSKHLGRILNALWKTNYLLHGSGW
jgi:hypothetical protein